MDIISTKEIIQMAITGGTGLLGIGIGIGLFKGAFGQFKIDLEKIKRRQAKIRGEDNGEGPIFMTRVNCEDLREKCGVNINYHDASIKRLDNFARWWMQKEGLTFHEINDILGKNNK